MQTDEKTCPQCAETVKSAAVKCRYCGHIFTHGSPAPQPVAGPPRPKERSTPVVIGYSLLATVAVLIFAALLNGSRTSPPASVPDVLASPDPSNSPPVVAHTQNAIDKEIEEDTKPIPIPPKLAGDECRSVWTDSVASFQDAVQDRMGPTVTVKPTENRYYPPFKGLRHVVMRFTAGDHEWVATGTVDPTDCRASVNHIKPVVRFLP